MLMTVVAAFSMGQVGDTIFIKSLKELTEQAGKSDVTVKMKAGVYNYKSSKYSQNLIFKRFQDGKEVKDLNASTLIHFSGKNSTYILTGAIINIDTKLHREFGKNELYEILVSGKGNVIKGLTVKDASDDNPVHRAEMLHVMGDDNTISNADLFVQGSTPYGYGHLLGKGRNPLVPLHKHSVLLVTGQNTKLLNCKVVTHAYGHAIFMQGAVNTLLKNCYVEGKMRPTNEMLAETSGLANGADFKSDYPPGKIMPNEMKSLSEDGIRTYPSGGLHGRRTKGVTVINCTVKNMRSGFDLSANLPPTKVIGSTAIGCQEKGFSIGTDGVIENSKGDALYGPLLTFVGNNVKNCKVQLELVDTVSIYKVNRLAEINGSGHQITLTNYQGKKRSIESPIVFGESFWDDVHRYRKPDAPHGSFAGAENIKLMNYTGMPVRLNDLSINCSISNALKVNQPEVINAGVGGNNTLDLESRIDKDVLSQNPDLTIIMVGTNDKLNLSKLVSYEDYEAKLNQMILRLKDAGSDVLIMSAPPGDSTYIYARNGRSNYPDAPNVMLDSLRNIVKQLAEQNAIMFLDLFEEFSNLNLPLHNQDVFFRNVYNYGKNDGVHPTDVGYYVIAKKVFLYLKTNDLLGQYSKIICFGDSITSGSSERGKGANDCRNYPCFLNDMLQENAYK